MRISTDGESLARCTARCCRRCAMWVLLCIGSVYCSGGMEAQDAKPQATNSQSSDFPTYASRHPAPAESADAVTRRPNSAADVKRSPTSAHNEEPAPARVALENGNLTVVADNSDLGQILKTVAGITGMTIDGNVRSSRVYGVYGPRNPRDVLTDLLTGSGYNFIMVGVTHDGAPRELLLSAEKTKSASEPSAVVTRAPEAPEVGAQDQLGPGAIAHVPPPPPEDPQERVRQNLQRLRQMHEKLKEGNAPQ